MTTIYLVRHGETFWNVEGRTQGHSMESALTENGRGQAKKVAEVFSSKNIDLIFASDLTRTKQTAEIINQILRREVKFDERLRDVNVGRFAGQMSKEWRATLFPEFEKYYRLPEEEKWDFKPHPDVESNLQIAKRMGEFLKEVAEAHKGKNILVVTHGAPITISLVKFGGMPYDTIHVGLGNCGYVEMRHDGRKFKIKRLEGLNDKITG